MILVAGGAGMLGVEVVRRLVARGVAVRVLTRRADAARRRVGGGVEIVAGDVRDAASLAPALSGVDVVVSAVTGYGMGGQGVAAVDQQGNANLVDASALAGVRRFVLVSAEWASPDHPMELMRRKYAAEEHLRRAQLDWAIVRPTALAELWIDLVGQAVRRGGAVPMFGGGDNPVSFAACGDVAEVVVRCALAPGPARTTLAVGGPTAVSMRELAAIVGSALGRAPKLRPVPVLALRAGRLVLRRVRPDVAGLMEGGLFMAKGDLSFDPTALLAALPGLQLTPIAAAVRSWAALQPGKPHRSSSAA